MALRTLTPHLRHVPSSLGIIATPTPQALPSLRSSGSRRTFFSLPNALASALPGASSSSPPGRSPHTLTAARTLPYPPGAVYELIADVDAYAAFLPHCAASRVTAWTRPVPVPVPVPGKRRGENKDGAEEERRWPARADLTVGWGGWAAQRYTSRLYCLPPPALRPRPGFASTSAPAHTSTGGQPPRQEERAHLGVVEAISGRGPGARPSLTAAERAEMVALGLLDPESNLDPDGHGSENEMFESLVTRWTVAPLLNPGKEQTQAQARTQRDEWTRVELHIRYQFANPLYQLATASLGGEMARMMVEAFEARARDVLGRPGR